MDGENIISNVSSETSHFIKFRLAPKALRTVIKQKVELIEAFGEEKVNKTIEILEYIVEETKSLRDKQKLKARKFYDFGRRRYKSYIPGVSHEFSTSCDEIYTREITLLHGMDKFYLNKNRSTNHLIIIKGEDIDAQLNLFVIKATRTANPYKAGITGEVNYLYIADRVVGEMDRGKGIGGELMEIAHQIAIANNCDFIVCYLSADKPEQWQKKLENSHKKMGYNVIQGGVAYKILSQNGKRLLEGK